MKLVRNALFLNLMAISSLTNVNALTIAQANTNPATTATPAAAVAPAPAPAAATLATPTTNLHIAVVDVTVLQQRFIEEVNTKLQKDFKDRQNSIQKMVDKFKDDQEKLQKDQNIKSAAQIADAKTALATQQNQLELEAKRYDDDLNVKRQEELKTRLDNLMQVVNSMSTKNKYDMIVAKNVALFVDPKHDITDAVVKAYDELALTKTSSNSKGKKSKTG